MRQPDDAELTLWMDTAENCVRQLKSDIEAQDFYVAANVATSSVPFSHLTKAFDQGTLGEQRKKNVDSQISGNSTLRLHPTTVSFGKPESTWR